MGKKSIVKEQEYYNEILNSMQFEALKSWCDINLTVAQRKEIFKGSIRYEAHAKATQTYLYDINGEFIDVFESRTDCAEHISVLLACDCDPTFVSMCVRKYRPAYKTYWVTNSFPLDKTKYNNENLYKKNKKN